jgi:hypothetical protein
VSSLWDEEELPLEVPVSAMKKPVRIYWPDGTSSVVTETHDNPDFRSLEWIARRVRLAEALTGGKAPADVMAATKLKIVTKG